MPCDQAPRFTHDDATFIAHVCDCFAAKQSYLSPAACCYQRFIKEYLEQDRIRPYVAEVGVVQLRDVPDIKLGRDDDYDDW